MKKAIYIFKGKCNGVDIVKVIIIILLIIITIVGSWYFVYNRLQGNANDLKTKLKIQKRKKYWDDESNEENTLSEIVQLIISSNID